jgi:hypothetical protein
MKPSKYDQSKEYFITYSILIQAAQKQGCASYKDIAQAVGLPPSGNYMARVLGELLGSVSANEKKQGRPMLSAAAVSVSGRPGDGFYTWARDLGFLKEGADEKGFWESELQKVYEEWSAPPPSHP